MAAYRMGSASAEKPPTPKTIKHPAQRNIFTREKIKNAMEESDGMGGCIFLNQGLTKGMR